MAATSMNVSTIQPPGDMTEEDDLSMLPVAWSVTATVCICVAIATAVGGNILVLLSYRRDRGLRNVHNLYLLNLAVSDLILGAVSMPLYLVYTVMYWTWPFGPVLCKIFLVEDFTFCSMSTLVVILVAWDRLALVQNGARYSIVETKHKAYVKLAVSWTFSFLLYSPAIILWDVIKGRSVVPADDCDVEFHADFVFTITTEIIAFAVPFISLTVINTLLFLALRKSGRKVAAHAQRDQQNATSVTHAHNKLENLDRYNQRDQQGTSQVKDLQIPTSHNQEESSLSSNLTQIKSDNLTVDDSAASTQQRSAQNTHHEPHNKHADRRSRDRRVAVILILLVLALVVCWLPYSITTIIIAACGSCVNNDLYEFFNWLLWIKSCVNPFLYAYNSPRFRKNFLELLSPVLPSRCGEKEVKVNMNVSTVSPGAG